MGNLLLDDNDGNPAYTPTLVPMSVFEDAIRTIIHLLVHIINQDYRAQLPVLLAYALQNNSPPGKTGDGETLHPILIIRYTSFECHP